MSFLDYIHYVPIFTTIFSVYFTYEILSRWRTKPDSLYLLWWGIGVAVYGLGTLVESLNTLMGWHIIIFKTWYIAGALLGGAPLALGTVYLLMKKKAGHIAVAIMVVTVSITSVFVIMSPVDYSLVEPNILNSKVLVWQNIRLVSPFVNTAAALFLIGGAFYSAFNFRSQPELRHRYIGNIYIAIGAILPGIGGGFSRAGFTEALYVGEFIGLLLIWYGYKHCQKRVKSPDLVHS